MIIIPSLYVSFIDVVTPPFVHECITKECQVSCYMTFNAVQNPGFRPESPSSPVMQLFIAPSLPHLFCSIMVATCSSVSRNATRLSFTERWKWNVVGGNERASEGVLNCDVRSARSCRSRHVIRWWKGSQANRSDIHGIEERCKWYTTLRCYKIVQYYFMPLWIYECLYFYGPQVLSSYFNT